MHLACICVHLGFPNILLVVVHYTYLMIVPCFVKIRVNFAEKLRFGVILPKLHAHFHALCMHAGMCTGPNNLKQIARPNFIYAEGLVKLRLQLVALTNGQWTTAKFI